MEQGGEGGEVRQQVGLVQLVPLVQGLKQVNLVWCSNMNVSKKKKKYLNVLTHLDKIEILESSTRISDFVIFQSINMMSV